MLLHIVRHGQTNWNAEGRIQGQLDSELDDLGIEQACQRGKDFTKNQFSAIYSSSSLRTRQTTEHLLDNLVSDRTSNNSVDLKASVLYMDELREVCLGVWEGHLWIDIQAAYPDMVEAQRTASDKFVVEGAETALQTQQRGVKAIESIIKRQEDAAHFDDANELLIVSHGAIMKRIFAYYLDIPLASVHALPQLPNCAHCIIEVKEQQRKVIQIAGVLTEETEWSK